MSHAIVDLSIVSPLAQGREHRVFQDPRHSGQLIKVMKVRPQRSGLRRPSIRRYGQFRVWHMDISEYLTALHRLGRHCDHLARPCGFCETTEGLGYVVERIQGADGQLAPMLRTALSNLDGDRARFDQLYKAGEALFDGLLAAGVEWKGMSLNNAIVSGGETPVLVVIDGLGRAPLIPLAQMSDRVFAMQHKKQKQRFLAEIHAMKPA